VKLTPFNAPLILVGAFVLLATLAMSIEGLITLIGIFAAVHGVTS